MFLTVSQLSAYAHEGQYRRDGVTPYILHIYAVLERLNEDGDDIDRAVARLHDALEADATNRLTVEDLRDNSVPEEVIDGVLTLTRCADETYEEFILRIKNHRDGRWVKVKIADILANLSDDPTWSQIRKYAKALLVLVPEWASP